MFSFFRCTPSPENYQKQPCKLWFRFEDKIPLEQWKAFTLEPHCQMLLARQPWEVKKIAKNNKRSHLLEQLFQNESQFSSPSPERNNVKCYESLL